MLSTSRPQESAGASQLRNPRREPPPVRTFELVRAKFDKVLEINALKQTFFADIFFEFKIRGGALDEDLSREGDGPPSTHFPKDTLRPSARWYLNQFDFSNSVYHTVHHDTTVVTRGKDIHLRYRAFGEFAEQLELEDFPFDTQELTVKLIVHCVIGGVVGVELVPADFTDDFSDATTGARAVPRAEYRASAVLSRPPVALSHVHFKVDHFHLHNVWDLGDAVYGHIEVHAGEFPQLAMTCLVRRRPQFYLWNVVVTMVLLEAMAFSAFTIETETTEGVVGRISLALTLVLTCGIYRQTNAVYSPPVACLTLLDEYMLLSSLVIGATVLVHALLALEMAYYGSAGAQPYLVAALAAATVAQHIYVIYWRVRPATDEAIALGFDRPLDAASGSQGEGRRSSTASGADGRHGRQSTHHYSHMGVNASHASRTNAFRVFSSEKGRYTYVALDEHSKGGHEPDGSHQRRGGDDAVQA